MNKNKKFLCFIPNDAPELKKLYNKTLFWIENNKGEDLGRIDKVKVGRKMRMASVSDLDVFMTSECHRQIADYLDKLESEKK